MSIYPFIEAEKACRRYVKRACELLKVSRAAFYVAIQPGPGWRWVARAICEELGEGVERVDAPLGGGGQVGLDCREVGEAVERAPAVAGGALLDFDGADVALGLMRPAIRRSPRVGSRPCSATCARQGPSGRRVPARHLLRPGSSYWLLTART